MTSAAPKRSLFSKPSWATSTTAPIKKADDDEPFGRSRIYEDIIAEKKRKKEKQAAKAKARGASEASKARQSKRRRISDEHEDSDSDAASSESEKSDEDHEEDVVRAGPVTRGTPTKRKFGAVLNSPVKPVISKPSSTEAASILLGDDDDIQITATNTAVRPPTKPTQPKDDAEESQSDPESDDDDEYIRNLKRRAKEKRLADRQAALAVKSPIDPSTSMTESLELGSPIIPDGELPKDQGQQVSLYITSIYPGSKPLIVGYHATKALGQVRKVWLAKQASIPHEKHDSFWLTFNGAKLFDSSTLVKSNIMESLKKQRPTEDDPSKGKIHLEVMNAEIMEHRRQQKERAEAEVHGYVEQEGEKAPSEEPVPRSKEPKITISLNAQEAEPMKLAVRLSTLIGRIMTAYHHQMGVEEGRVCWLVFDGERLEPTDTVGSVGFEDGDVVEVLIR